MLNVYARHKSWCILHITFGCHLISSEARRLTVPKSSLILAIFSSHLRVLSRPPTSSSPLTLLGAQAGLPGGAFRDRCACAADLHMRNIRAAAAVPAWLRWQQGAGRAAQWLRAAGKWSQCLRPGLPTASTMGQAGPRRRPTTRCPASCIRSWRRGWTTTR